MLSLLLAYCRVWSEDLVEARDKRGMRSFSVQFAPIYLWRVNCVQRQVIWLLPHLEISWCHLRCLSRHGACVLVLACILGVKCFCSGVEPAARRAGLVLLSVATSSLASSCVLLPALNDAKIEMRQKRFELNTVATMRPVCRCCCYLLSRATNGLEIDAMKQCCSF